jgi:pimeloyl-ACP methyl ester carboxylesterase
MELRHRSVETNGIRLHIAEQGSGPLIVFCHGFPESWYSWRHQMAALPEAGFRVVAPDQRGYGQSDAPSAIEAYTLCHLAGDIVGLVYALNEERAVIAGHDWGAAVAWTCALLRPDIFQALCLMSVPYLPFSTGDPKPTDIMKAIFPEKEFYQLYFQEPGRAEEELEQDVRSAMLRLLHSGSGDAPEGEGFPFVFDRSQRFIDGMILPESLPAWLTEDDLDYFVREFTRTGFRGGLNWYRNMDRNWELLGALRNARIRQPAIFLAGERDVVVGMYRAAFDALEQTVPGLTGKYLIPGAGHWVQQEKPEEINNRLLEFLERQREAPGSGLPEHRTAKYSA